MDSVQTLFFASYRDLVGTGTLHLTLSAPVSVGEFVARVRGQGPPFDRLPTGIAVAVNREVVPSSHLVRPGDEVAFLPPVAGG